MSERTWSTSPSVHEETRCGAPVWCTYALRGDAHVHPCWRVAGHYGAHLAGHQPTCAELMEIVLALTREAENGS
jgi:hypothetical protein